MEKTFWEQRWERNEIGFHEPEANPALVKYFGELALPKGSRLFLPLCGKSLDIHWLLSRGYRVAGAELTKIAVEQLFAELGVKPQIKTFEKNTRYSAEGIDIFQGDIFQLSGAMLGPIYAIYDRAALVALPPDLRERYTAHLIQITGGAPQLLISYVYDQALADGPPFSVDAQEIHRHYETRYDLKLLEKAAVKGGMKGKCSAEENVWLLSSKRQSN